MKKYVNKIIDNNWFFVSLVLFVLVLPLSQALVSISAGIIFFVALVEDSWSNKIYRLKQNWILFALPAIYLIYIVSSFISNKLSASLYDLQKSLFFLILPLAFLIGKNISAQQKRTIFYAFLISVVASTLVAIFNWKLSDNSKTFSVHKISLISHIRFSFQLILSFWFVVIIYLKNVKDLSVKQQILLLLSAAYFIAFLLFQQSLTGLFALTGSIFFFMFLSLFKATKKVRLYLFIFTLALIITPTIYIIQVIQKFYDIETVDKNNIDIQTEKGNTYIHDFHNPMIENGKYVYLYVCPEEMREEWNKISKIKYDSIGASGYPLSSTLIRYLTSKGLRKDARGVKSLNRNDVQNIENGIANVIYADGKVSIYPRIYQTIWEYYIYSKTGNANQKSFSQRIEYAKAAISIIKQNPWFGVGTGNWKEEFKKAYQKNSPDFREENYASSHNQYLNYMVKFGIIGFVVLLSLILFPVIKTRVYKDQLFLLFLVFMFFANFGDSNFESHMGSSFFVFFYCVFIFGGNTYLELDSSQKFTE